MIGEVGPKPWDFKPVLDLLDAFSSFPNPLEQDVSKGFRSPPLSPDLSFGAPASLGDFDRVWRHLGKPINTSHINLPYGPFESSSPTSDPYSTDSSSPPDDGEHFFELNGKSKELRWKDEVAGTDLAESRQRGVPGLARDDDTSIERLLSDVSPINDTTSTSKTTKCLRRPRGTTRSSDNYASEFESETEGDQAQPTIPCELIPSLVTPRQERRELFEQKSLPLPKFLIDPTIIQPRYLSTAKEKKAKLIKKLIEKFGPLPASVSTIGTYALSHAGGHKSDEGIHVFVDCSNIVIGFYNALKIARNINILAYIKQPPISYHSLSLILERGRAVSRRVLLGSIVPALHNQEIKLPGYMAEARQCGYEVNVLNRVMKPKPPTPSKKKKGGNGNGYATTSGHSSGSEGTISSARVMAEQGVDEILHMKLLESLVDTVKPSTIVLASGDAAEAEYSGGFLRNVERALVKGWKVELVAWSAGLSQEYRSMEFLKRWKGRFTIIELDDFSEELLAVYR